LRRLKRPTAARTFYEKALADAVNAQDTLVEARIRNSIESLPPE
jgi:hypothetical protein